MVAPERTLLVVNEEHERFYARHTADWLSSSLLVQPHNHGTSAAILLTLLHISKFDPDAMVAFFPSDHYFSDDAALVRYVRLAFTEADYCPRKVFLLGVAPEYPETEYGWIEPGASTGRNFPIFEVRHFWEKPTEPLARQLMERGCLWNSFIMVGAVSAFLTLIERTVPRLMHAFLPIRCLLATPAARGAVRALYGTFPPGDFSRDVLSPRPSELAVIRAENLGWSDLGEPARLRSAIRRRVPEAAAAAFAAGRLAG